MNNKINFPIGTLFHVLMAPNGERSKNVFLRVVGDDCVIRYFISDSTSMRNKSYMFDYWMSKNYLELIQ